MKSLKNQSIRSLVDSLLAISILAQIGYLFHSVFSSSETLTINIPFYSPIGLVIAYGVLCLSVWALSYVYEILRFGLNVYIGVKALSLTMLLLVGPFYKNSQIEITVAPWEKLDTALFVVALMGRFALGFLNKKYNIEYKSKSYYRLLKLKHYRLINQPIKNVLGLS